MVWVKKFLSRTNDLKEGRERIMIGYKLVFVIESYENANIFHKIANRLPAILWPGLPIKGCAFAHSRSTKF